MEVLARGANFEITAKGGTVRLTVINRPEVDRDEGARCAQLMHDTLTSRVLLVRSPYRALVVDVRQGPEVFGPKTRASHEELFRAAEFWQEEERASRKEMVRQSARWIVLFIALFAFGCFVTWWAGQASD